jgi:hypothetical protein
MTINNTNYTVANNSATSDELLTLDQWFTLLGSSFVIDGFYLFVFTPVSFIGLISNMISCTVFCQEEFKNNIHKYFKFYSINSAVLNLFGIFCFCFSRRFLKFASNYYAIAFLCYVIIPVTNTCYFIGGIMDLIILLERLSAFLPNLRRLQKYQPKYIVIIIIIICLVINFPYFFVYVPSSLSIRLKDQNDSIILHYIDLSQLSKSQLGKIITYVEYFFRDIMTLILENILNTMSILLLRRYVSRKQSALGLSKNTLTSRMNENQTNESLRQRDQQQAKSQRNDTDIASNRANSLSKLMHKRMEIKANLNKMDLKLTIMVILMCAFSTIEHIMLVICIVYFYYYNNLTAYSIGVTANFIIILKNATNFIFFIIFNNNFKNALKRILRPLSR